MTDNKKTAADGFSIDGGGEKGCWQAPDNPHIDFTTGPKVGQAGIIAGLLLHGSENGLTLQDLRRITGWPERTIRKAIETERRAGTLIINDNRNGYFLTDDPGEAARFARSMKHRAAQIRKTTAAIEKAAGLL